MSRWYAAHILMYVRRKRKSATKMPVWENIVLIKAETEEQAFAKAQQRGKEDEGDDNGTFLWAGEPAEWVFAGVRKLTLCEDSENRPADGCEVSYIQMEVDSHQALMGLLEGTAARVRVTDHAPEDRTRNSRRTPARRGA